MKDTRSSGPTSQGRLRNPLSASIDWTLLEVASPAGKCEACGMPVWAVAHHYKVPGVSGWFCCVLCLECALVGRRRCRWCAKDLRLASQRFCDDACRHNSNRIPFGDGTRFLNFLSRSKPRLYVRIGGQRRCLHCGDPLVDRQASAKFCGDRCRKAHGRATSLAIVQQSGQRADTNTSHQQLTDPDFESQAMAQEIVCPCTSRTECQSKAEVKGSAN